MRASRALMQLKWMVKPKFVNYEFTADMVHGTF